MMAKSRRNARANAKRRKAYRRKKNRECREHVNERAAWLRWGALVVVYLVSAVMLRQCDVHLPDVPRPPKGG